VTTAEEPKSIPLADPDGALWRAFVEASPDVLFVLDPEGSILFVNRVGPAVGDRPVVGRKIWEFALGDAETRIRQHMLRIIETRSAVQYEQQGVRWDGSPTWYEVRGIPVVVAGRVERVIWTAADISERKNEQEQLRQSQKMEAIGLLAGGVAHDFNNLLAVILGFSELAARKLPPGHPVADQLSEVFDAARRGSDLTRKLLAFSRKQIIQPRPLDLGATVGDFTRLLARILGEDVDLVVDGSPEPLVVRADPVQLEQVLLNLCTNARQAMPKGGSLRLSMRAASFDEGRVRREPWASVGAYVELAVSDTGVGMDEATRLRVFEPFFTTKPEGTGLGLATVYGIVRQHGGFVHVESAPDHGTTFRVFLPAADVADVAQVPSGAISSHQRRLRGAGTILLAEDEPSLRALVSTTLTEHGYRVVATADGEEAVREYERLGSEVALVLLDVVMPRLDARAAYERIAAIRPGVRVLFMTGYAPESTRLAELIDRGRLPVIEKPFTPTALAAKVRSILDARPPA
jgi:PAS domain S-box-containing protein